MRAQWVRALPPGEAQGNWVWELRDQLKAREISIGDSELDRYLRLNDMESAFLKTYRRSPWVTWAHVRELLGVKDPDLRLELLNQIKGQGLRPLSVRDFRALVKTWVTKSAKKKQAAPRKVAVQKATRELAALARRAASAAEKWLDGDGDEAAALAAAADVDPASASRVLAAVSQFRAAAAGLTKVLEDKKAALGGSR